MPEPLIVPPGLVERITKLRANSRWAIAHDDELQKHVWRFVAIDDERVLGVADSRQELRKRFAYRDALYILQVTPTDMAWMFSGQN